MLFPPFAPSPQRRGLINEDVRADDGGGRVADADAVLPLPLEFEALYVANQEAFHDYALFYLGGNDAAEEAVHRA
ncbi:hypothetical protein [Streptomyces actinomycinicus]|uniref:hypothetical protein n=1 Tax=Streptomyces actinomycinicus TaxID=1695166 RepID=UPI001F3BFBBB|nr:hypothetical protein [Streptomyces actinomycinicus]